MTRYVYAIAISTLAFASLAVSIPGAEAGPKCKARISAKGTGQGILGAGTMNAKVAAIEAFEGTAAKTYGRAYGKFDNAKGTRFDCRSGTLKATCVVTGRPCK
jgi:hypothetical protein